MNTRQLGITWFRAHKGTPSGRIHVSKYYDGDESWTHRPVWWFEISASVLEDDDEIHLLCQKADPPEDFHCLRVPTAFLRARLTDLWVRKDKGRLSLFLSAEEHNRFEEMRGKGGVLFTQFLV